MTLYHGTAGQHLDAISTEGIVPLDGVGPYVAEDYHRAVTYALFSCCLLEDETPGSIMTGVVLVIDPAGLDLTPDPAGVEGDSIVSAAVPSSSLTGLTIVNAWDHTEPHEVAERAGTVRLARRLERMRRRHGVTPRRLSA